jgi:hypothetical protein
MRNTIALALLLGISCASFSQTKQASWATLSGLKPGQQIQIVEITSKKHSGTFESASDSAISIREASGEASIQKQDVRSVKLKSKRRLRNTLIGLGVGAGGGAAIGAAIGPSNGWIIGKGYTALFVGVIGAVSGTAVGALLPTHDTVYQVSSH